MTNAEAINLLIRAGFHMSRAKDGRARLVDSRGLYGTVKLDPDKKATESIERMVRNVLRARRSEE